MIHERDEMQWNQNLCLPSTSMAGSTSGSGNSWTAGTSQGITSPKRPTPDLKLSTSGIRIRSRRWTWISSPESVMRWTAHQPTLLNIHLADALWLYAAALFLLKCLAKFCRSFQWLSALVKSCRKPLNQLFCCYLEH